MITKKDIGKKIKFKIGGCMWIPQIEIRKILAVSENYIMVKYSGCNNFLIRQNEVIELIEG